MEQSHQHGCNCPYAGTPMPSQAEMETILRSGARDQIVEMQRRGINSMMSGGYDHDHNELSRFNAGNQI